VAGRAVDATRAERERAAVRDGYKACGCSPRFYGQGCGPGAAAGRTGGALTPDGQTSPPTGRERGQRRRRARQGRCNPHEPALRERAATPQARSGGGAGEGFLADTLRSNGRGGSRALQMPEELPANLAVRDVGDDPQAGPATLWRRVPYALFASLRSILAFLPCFSTRYRRLAPFMSVSGLSLAKWNASWP
jgi:hypothetical protein